MRRLGGLLLAIACLALAQTLAPAPAFGQAAYPSRPIRVLIPYAPGGLTDVVARYYADHLRKSFGQNVLVENKPGASGIIAIEEMARAKPDGYTIMVGNISTNCLTPVLLSKRMKIDYDRRSSRIEVRTADHCSWVAVSNAAWIFVVSNASGTGDADVTIGFAENDGPQRTGTVTLAGQIVTVVQKAEK